ncbi:hypothetical protein TWF694_009372 [Orbilia ellipsospora]|uniref:Purine nucleoside permease n=1 Tax=Orbilia ellipsospora TaxID=2528407 RepID=A0AAV9XF97_9PEZI
MSLRLRSHPRCSFLQCLTKKRPIGWQRTVISSLNIPSFCRAYPEDTIRSTIQPMGIFVCSLSALHVNSPLAKIIQTPANLDFQVINAALSTYALTSSPMFDLRKTYFILSGISGVNPKRATIGSVSFAKFAIQMDTQLEWDSREIPSSWITGYAPLEGTAPDSFPGLLHGSEVYELNEKLQQLAISFAKTAKLHDTPAAEELRVPYRNSLNGVYKAALTKPMVLEGDVASSNVFFHGRYICEGVEKLFKIYTSGQADYVMTANEDTAILTALLRAAIQEKVDFGRVILTRAGCNFDREAVDDPPTLPFEMDRGGVAPATRNLYLTGVKIAFGIVKEWEKHFDGGIETKNYVGDVFGSLGREPDFIPKKPSL